MFLNLEDAKKGYNKVILLNKDNPNYDPTKAERDVNSQLTPKRDRLCLGLECLIFGLATIISLPLIRRCPSLVDSVT